MKEHQLAAELAEQIYHDRILNFFDQSYDIEGKVYHRDGKVWLVWRGTESLVDWLVNLQLYQEMEGEIGIHAGFNRAYKKVRSQVHRATKDYSNLIVVGHSLGGAIGQLCGLHLASLGKGVRVYSFGSPKVGSVEFAQLCDSYLTHYRYANKYDLVPYLPFGKDFQHGGKEIELCNINWNPHRMKSYQF